MTLPPTKESGSKENVEWAYDVVGSGLTIYTLCDLKAERDALREALEKIANQSYADAHRSFSTPVKIARAALERTE